MGNVVRMSDYKEAQEKKDLKWELKWEPWLLVEESTAKIIALIDRKSFSFRKSIESKEAFEEVIEYLKRNWIKDLNVSLKDWTEIVDNIQAVWHDTFIFSDEASIFLLDLLWNIYDYSITGTWNTLIVAK